LVINGATSIGGSLAVTGPSGMVFTGAAQILGDVEVQHDLTLVGASAVTRDEPCRCGAGETLDIPGVVAQGRANNDNASIGLAPGAFDVVVGAASIELPCGRFHLNSILGAGAFRLGVSGRTALFVDGSIDVAGAFDIDLGPQG